MSSITQDGRLQIKTQPKTDTSGMVTLNLKIEQPDIILVESMDDKDCQALVMNVRFLIIY